MARLIGRICGVRVLLPMMLTILWGWPAGAQETGAGRHCYRVQDETVTAGAQLEIDEYGSVSGTLDAVVHDEANSYWTSYSQEVVGQLQADRAELAVTTWIEYDVQDTRETWTVTAERLETPQATLEAVDCEALQEALEEMGFARSWTEMGPHDYPHHYRRVRFDPPWSSAIYRNAVVRGDRDIYLLRAREGQVLTLWIDAVEDNAVFDLIAPDGRELAQESRETRLELPMHGEYRIQVGGTRGNAGYELVIALR